MISVYEAQKKLVEESFPFGSETVGLMMSDGRVLAEDICATFPHPNFDQSAVDGYACRFEDVSLKRGLKRIAEVPAGHTSSHMLKKGECMRIFTGGMVPLGADTVIMQEHVNTEADLVFIQNDIVRKGDHIRYCGEQINAGDIALKAGHTLNSASIGLLSTLGVSEVNVQLKPTVCILNTGDELISIGTPLTDGKIYDSNGYMLQNVLTKAGIYATKKTIQDRKDTLKNAITDAMNSNELILITGGVSVGDYDYTLPALEELGFTVLFHKVGQKPGKPLLFAKNGSKIAFGLPGNPRAVLMCYYQYVLPFIKCCMNAERPFPLQCKMPLTHAYTKKGSRLNFVMGTLNSDGVEILSGQGSHMLQSFAEGTCMVAIPEETTYLEKGDLVDVHLLSEYI